MVAKILKFPTFKPNVDWKEFHISTKSGPLGQALMTSQIEATYLSPMTLLNIKKLGGSKLAKIIEELSTKFDVIPESISGLWEKLYPIKHHNMRKISYFADKEGKTREIAIMAYFVQTALKPLHKVLNRILRKIPTDCTFNQNRFSEILPSTGTFYSFDLSRATDRMPIVLQRRIIALLIGETKADAWKELLVGEGFHIKGIANPVKYGAGQPMGAYSSWPSMALTHHFIIIIAGLRAKLSQRVIMSSYTVLGDDLVIANKLLAESYLKILAELDMPISLEKSHISINCYEFAKRWIIDGKEITGFSTSGLLEVWKKYPLLLNFLLNQESHG
jgi:hypothetical protein